MLPTRSILEAYRAFDVDNREHVHVWARLADHINSEYNTLKRYRALPVIEFVQVNEPYADLAEMQADFHRKHMKVSALNYQHPVFTRKTNLRFRILHDIVHCVISADFDEGGEYKVFQHQSEGLPADLVSALYTEIVIQASHKIHYGYFSEQKLFLTTGV